MLESILGVGMRPEGLGRNRPERHETEDFAHGPRVLMPVVAMPIWTSDIRYWFAISMSTPLIWWVTWPCPYFEDLQ